MYSGWELYEPSPGANVTGCPVPDATVNGTTGPVPGECNLGGQPSYVVKAGKASAVQKAVDFARTHNLRLRIKNVSGSQLCAEFVLAHKSLPQLTSRQRL